MKVALFTLIILFQFHCYSKVNITINKISKTDMFQSSVVLKQYMPTREDESKEYFVSLTEYLPLVVDEIVPHSSRYFKQDKTPYLKWNCRIGLSKKQGKMYFDFNENIVKTTKQYEGMAKGNYISGIVINGRLVNVSNEYGSFRRVPKQLYITYALLDKNKAIEECKKLNNSDS
ncbi:hypothetical protein [Halobacteriovorax sp. JY17]|uniref:hypothetical protein n=1 Tax=Halobacteriovorax sp. JY17 TaxID=2014617 RepID=UPI000C4028AF|nr:hypothetical protein [Halobacteriovorax sp. JY17]PIK15525.1 MAG: hypothetical protein CES88_02045 [Halobacteriovorax sp. JY17]